MAVASFEDFCSSLCGLLELQAPPLQPDEGGTVGFTVVWQGTRIGFMKVGEGVRAGIVMRVEYGVAPPDREAEIFRALLEANLRMTGLDAGAFVLHSQSGLIALHRPIPLQAIDVHDVFGDLEKSATDAAAWKKFYTSPPLINDGAQAFFSFSAHRA